MTVGENKMMPSGLSPCRKSECAVRNAAKDEKVLGNGSGRRRFVVIPLLFCLLVALLWGCAGEDSPDEAMTTAVANATVTITGSRSDSGSSKNPVLVVDYEFTNNTTAPASFAYLCKDTAYQNGVACEMDTATWATTPNLLYRDIKPGATQKLTIGYKLKSKTAVVEIEIKEWVGDEVLLRQILTP